MWPRLARCGGRVRADRLLPRRPFRSLDLLPAPRSACRRRSRRAATENRPTETTSVRCSCSPHVDSSIRPRQEQAKRKCCSFPRDEPERLHILDGHGYIFRAHYGLATGGKERQPVRLSRADGMPTGALYVYASMLIRLHLDERPQRIAVVFDTGKPSFRSELDAQYKANRSEARRRPPRCSCRTSGRLTEAFCWPVDVGGGGRGRRRHRDPGRPRARARDWDVVIYSGDKDLMQLVDDHVVVIDSMRQITYDAAGVKRSSACRRRGSATGWRWSATPVDNIPGVSGRRPGHRRQAARPVRLARRRARPRRTSSRAS